ncbi:hypothetical protein JN00_0018 [Metamycoplasma subdolum]|uniref:ZIP Zinc transporter n=1 Tax=Metamycoplasma subdolum TaxID=92407 RepID=A0A3M0A3E4_9BACT|nr:hypothetical protein [Metamycoplasma subdolum]RMA78974.1 hypothetical protein JN00_0018 [Metamycoplasma subdolum]WPB50497.1 hypothetical protein R9C05_02720 [Metamycoplasma subdolum]
MFFKGTDFGGNLYLVIFVNLLIYIAILLSVPMLFLTILSFIKVKITNKKTIYIYAFSTGMFLMIGSMGFMKEGTIQIETWFHTPGELGGLKYTNGNVGLERTYTALIIGLSTLIGLTIVILGRYLFIKASKTDPHSSHEEHQHSDHLISFRDVDNPKAAWTAILMILSHRIIDGLVLGYGVAQFSGVGRNPNVALMVTFNLHLLLELVIVYYRQLQYGETKKRAILFNFITLLVLIPIMFFGAFVGPFMNKVGWLIPSLEILGGAVIVFMSIVELVPEFIHYRNESIRIIYGTLIMLAISIIFTAIILSFHSHTQPTGITITIEKAKEEVKFINRKLNLWKTCNLRI